MEGCSFRLRPDAVRVIAMLVLLLTYGPVTRDVGAQPAPAPTPEPVAPPGANPPADPGATADPADPNPAVPPPVEPDPDTVLLRERWTPQEAARLRGMAHRISRVLESPAEKVPLKDSAGRKFDMDYAGRIRFNPLDDNWKPVIPNVAEVPFHLAEAESLRRFGLKNEALAIWKSLRAMALFTENPPAYVKQGAADATKRINGMRSEDPDFETLDRATDPYLFYNDTEDHTMLISDRYGWRVKLPGRFRFARAKQGASRDRSRDMDLTSVHLKQGPVVLLIHSDLWARGWKFPKVQGYARVWDFRRSLGPQRSRDFQFTREPHPQSDRCVPARLTRQLAPTGRAKCAVFQTLLSRRGKEFHSMEFFHLRPFAGFMVELRFAVESQARADIVLQSMLNDIVFSDR